MTHPDPMQEISDIIFVVLITMTVVILCNFVLDKTQQEINQEINNLAEETTQEASE